MFQHPLTPSPLSWPAAAGYAVEAVAAAAFVIAVYETVVGGVVRLWPDVSDNLVLGLWVAAAVLCGLGMKVVRARARALLARVWPQATAEPYRTLVSFVADAAAVAAVASVEDALPRLARLVADATSARTVEVWITRASSFELAAGWPEDGQPRHLVSSLDALRAWPGIDHVVSVTEAGELFGALALGVADGSKLTARDLRLTANIANAAGLLLRNIELHARLREQIRIESEQAEALAASRRRMVVARDTAREQLGREIKAIVCEPLERCALELNVAPEQLDSPRVGAGPDLAGMIRRVDKVIGQFRRIVHGVYPSVLTDHGLVPALDNLVADLERRAELEAPELPRLPALVEAGGYFCAVTLLRAWPHIRDEQPIRVSVRVTDGEPGDSGERGELALAVSDAVPRAEGDLIDPLVVESVLDRVAALGGRLQQKTGPTGLSVMIQLPLPLCQPVVRRPDRSG